MAMTQSKLLERHRTHDVPTPEIPSPRPPLAEPKRGGRIWFVLAVVLVLTVTAVVGNSIRSHPKQRKPVPVDPQQIAIQQWKDSLAANLAKKWSPQEQAVVDAYRNYWQTVVSLGDPPIPFSARLKDVATGQALGDTDAQLAAYMNSGVVTRDRPNSIGGDRLDGVNVAGPSATVEGCSVDDGMVVKSATGDVVDDKTLTVSFSTFLNLVDNHWKVASIVSRQRSTGVNGCAVG